MSATRLRKQMQEVLSPKHNQSSSSTAMYDILKQNHRRNRDLNSTLTKQNQPNTTNNSSSSCNNISTLTYRMNIHNQLPIPTARTPSVYQITNPPRSISSNSNILYNNNRVHTTGCDRLHLTTSIDEQHQQNNNNNTSHSILITPKKRSDSMRLIKIKKCVSFSDSLSNSIGFSNSQESQKDEGCNLSNKRNSVEGQQQATLFARKLILPSPEIPYLEQSEPLSISLSEQSKQSLSSQLDEIVQAAAASKVIVAPVNTIVATPFFPSLVSSSLSQQITDSITDKSKLTLSMQSQQPASENTNRVQSTTTQPILQSCRIDLLQEFSKVTAIDNPQKISQSADSTENITHNNNYGGLFKTPQLSTIDINDLYTPSQSNQKQSLSSFKNILGKDFLEDRQRMISYTNKNSSSISIPAISNSVQQVQTSTNNELNQPKSLSTSSFIREAQTVKPSLSSFEAKRLVADSDSSKTTSTTSQHGNSNSISDSIAIKDSVQTPPTTLFWANFSHTVSFSASPALSPKKIHHQSSLNSQTTSESSHRTLGESSSCATNIHKNHHPVPGVARALSMIFQEEVQPPMKQTGSVVVLQKTQPKRSISETGITLSSTSVQPLHQAVLKDNHNNSNTSKHEQQPTSRSRQMSDARSTMVYQQAKKKSEPFTQSRSSVSPSPSPLPIIPAVFLANQKSSNQSNRSPLRSVYPASNKNKYAFFQPSKNNPASKPDFSPLRQADSSRKVVTSYEQNRLNRSECTSLKTASDTYRYNNTSSQMPQNPQTPGQNQFR